MVSEKKIFLCFSHDTPGACPVWIPGARLAGFMKRTTIHCYTQNKTSLGLVVSEKKIFPTVSLWELMTPVAGHFCNHDCMIGRIYKEDHYTLLHAKYERSGPCGFGEEDFFMLFHDAPGACPVWTPGAWLAGFIKRTTIHCYIQNMKALGLVIAEKKIFLCFSHCKSMGPNDPGWGYF